MLTNFKGKICTESRPALYGVTSNNDINACGIWSPSDLEVSGDAAALAADELLDLLDPERLHLVRREHLWHTYDSQDQIMAHIRQSGLDAGICKTVRTRFWQI